MKTIGLIGGMSWESSIEYYRRINQAVRLRLGGLHSAKCVMVSVDFAEVEPLQHEGKWAEATEKMVEAARHVQQGGADFLVLCTNTMHKTADELQRRVDVPLLHIADATARAIADRGIHRIGLLGTRFTMEDDFYKGRLTDRHDLEVIVPTATQRQTVHRIIYDELCLGKIVESSRAQYRRVIHHLAADGAQGIILGCTEIGLLVQQRDSPVPLFDTTALHAEAAVEYALRE